MSCLAMLAPMVTIESMVAVHSSALIAAVWIVRRSWQSWQLAFMIFSPGSAPAA